MQDIGNQRAAGRGGGVEAVVEILVQEECESSLLLSVYWAMASMTKDNACNQKAAERYGVLDAVIAGHWRERFAAKPTIKKRTLPAFDVDNKGSDTKKNVCFDHEVQVEKVHDSIEKFKNLNVCTWLGEVTLR